MTTSRYNGNVCNNSNNFNLYYESTKLDGKTLDAKQNLCQIPNVGNVDQCALYCSNNPDCQGFNYVTAIIPEDGSTSFLPLSCQNCEINSDNQCTDNKAASCCALMTGTDTTDKPISNVVGYTLDRSKNVSSPLKYDTSVQYRYNINPAHIEDTNDPYIPSQMIDGKEVWNKYPKGITKQVKPGIIIGYDYAPVFAKNVSTPSLCATMCSNKDDCKGYNYFIPKTDVKTPSGCVAGLPCCVLKTDTPDKPLDINISACQKDKDTNCVQQFEEGILNDYVYTDKTNKSTFNMYSAGYAIKGDKSNNKLEAFIIGFIMLIVVIGLSILFIYSSHHTRGKRLATYNVSPNEQEMTQI